MQFSCLYRPNLMLQPTASHQESQYLGFGPGSHTSPRNSAEQQVFSVLASCNNSVPQQKSTGYPETQMKLPISCLVMENTDKSVHSCFLITKCTFMPGCADTRTVSLNPRLSPQSDPQLATTHSPTGSWGTSLLTTSHRPQGRPVCGSALCTVCKKPELDSRKEHPIAVAVHTSHTCVVLLQHPHAYPEAAPLKPYNHPREDPR